MPLTPQAIDRAAALLWATWRDQQRLDLLPADVRPATPEDGFAVQAAVARHAADSRFGWKIAATSAAGQAHIGVDGPLPGMLLSRRVRQAPATFSLRGNLMCVAEAEFAFRFRVALPARAAEYTQAEVLDAVESLHPAIEVPDSRYRDFVTAGAPQLIADNACASWFSPGPATRIDWRSLDLSRHAVRATVNGAPAGEGTGAKVLGDPRIALTWIANALSRFGTGLAAGEMVTTGTCVTPIPVRPGDTVVVDFGTLGQIEAAFTD